MPRQIPQKAQRLHSSLKNAHSRLISLRGWAKFATFTSVFSISWIALVVIEHLFYLTAPQKIMGLLLSFVGLYFSYKYFRIEYIAPFKLLRNSFAKDTKKWILLDYLDLALKEKKSSSEDLAVARFSKQLDTEEIIGAIRTWSDEHPIAAKCRQRITWSAAIFLSVLSLSLSYLYPSGTRLAQFWTDSVRPNPFEFEIIPKQKQIEEGLSTSFGLLFLNDQIPFEKQLWLKSAGEKDFRPYSIRPDTSQLFLSTSFQIFGSTQFYFSMDGFLTDTLELSILKRPKLNKLQLVINTPSYLKQENDTLEYPFERITYPEYAQLSLFVEPSLETDSISIYINKDLWTKMDVSNDRLSFLLSDSLLSTTKTDTVDFELVSQNGLRLNNGYSFLLNMQPDLVPSVQWIDPLDGENIPENGPFELTYFAKDDHGLRTIWFNYEQKSSFGKIKNKGKINLEATDINGLGSIQTELNQKLSFAPKDELTLILSATDNDVMSGYKKAIADTITLRMPSLLAELDDLMEEEGLLDESIDEIEELQKEGEELSEQMKKGLRENPEQAWQQQRNVQEQIENQQKLQEKVQELNQQFEKLKEEMENTNLLSPETMQTYEEYQKLLEELKNDALKEALEEMQKALENMNPNQFRQTLEKLEFNEEVYKQRLERTVELFKQLKTEANLERMKQSLEKMATQQDSLANTTEPNVAAQQDLREALDKLEKAMDQLDQDAPKRSKDDLKKLQNELTEDNEQLKQEMDELLDQMKNETGESEEQQQQQQQQQQDMAKQMRQMSKMLENQQSMMSQQQLNINIAALKSILGSIVVSSEFQEEINIRTTDMVSRSLGFVEQARNQRALNNYYQSISDSLLIVASEVQELSNEIISLKERTKRTMDRALEQQSERSQNTAVVLERESLSGINELGQLIADVLEQLQNQMNSQGSGGGSGMSSQQALEQMQKMSGQQQQINQQIQQMINDMAGERLSMEQQKRLDQLSKQQNQIRKQLEDLQKSGAIPAGDRLQGELSRLQEEMEDSIRELRGGNLDDLLIKRQQNIMNRMLQAERSMQEQGEEEERKGETALQQLKNQSPELNLEEIQKLLEQQLNSDDYTPFKEDLRQLIRLYFERLKELQ